MMDSSVEALTAVKQIDEMALDVKASSENLRIVRLMVSAFGTSHGADVDDLEDLRIATGDICTHLIADAPEEARLVVRASVMLSPPTGSSVVGVHAHVLRPSDPGELDPISALVLGAATDAFGIEEWPATAPVTWGPGVGEHSSRLALSLRNGTRPDDGNDIAVGEGAVSEDGTSAGSGRSLNGWFSRGLGESASSDDNIN